MNRLLLAIMISTLLFSNEIYKEIRIDKRDISHLNQLQMLGIDIDHIYDSSDYFQFAINEHDLSKLIINNINFEVIHDNLEEFYQGRLIQNYNDNRDFEYGSMGGYYTFSEIEEQLDDLSSLYPEIISQSFQ